MAANFTRTRFVFSGKVFELPTRPEGNHAGGIRFSRHVYGHQRMERNPAGKQTAKLNGVIPIGCLHDGSHGVSTRQSWPPRKCPEESDKIPIIAAITAH